MVIANSLSNTSSCSVNNNVRLIFFGQTFGFSNRCTLFTVFACYAFVALAAHGPTFFIGHHMLVPCAAPFIPILAVDKNLNKLN